jgi:hypothetical protein
VVGRSRRYLKEETPKCFVSIEEGRDQRDDVMAMVARFCSEKERNHRTKEVRRQKLRRCEVAGVPKDFQERESRQGFGL